MAYVLLVSLFSKEQIIKRNVLDYSSIQKTVYKKFNEGPGEVIE